jgi:hypothetical protein
MVLKLIRPESVKKLGISHYQRDCPKCGETLNYQSNTARSAAINADNENRTCRKCASYLNRGQKGLPDGTWYEEETKKYCKKCPECGDVQKYTRPDHLKNAVKTNKICKTCSNQSTENSNRGNYKNSIRISWFNKFKTSAGNRGIQWNLTIEDIYQIAYYNKFECQLSGLPLNFATDCSLTEATVSIDRIDSSYGYSKDNVMLVHKHINMMKQNYDLDYFVSLCAQITLKQSEHKPN